MNSGAALREKRAQHRAARTASPLLGDVQGRHEDPVQADPSILDGAVAARAYGSGELVPPGAQNGMITPRPTAALSPRSVPLAPPVAPACGSGSGPPKKQLARPAAQTTTTNLPDLANVMAISCPLIPFSEPLNRSPGPVPVK